MGLTDSPDMTYYEEGKPPDDKEPFFKSNLLRIVIGLQVLIVLVLGGIYLAGRGSSSTESEPTGVVTGQLVDSDGAAVIGAAVYADTIGTTETVSDGTGLFTLPEVPEGEQFIVIGVTPDPPVFLPVSVEAGSEVNVGRVVVR